MLAWGDHLVAIHARGIERRSAFQRGVVGRLPATAEVPSPDAGDRTGAAPSPASYAFQDAGVYARGRKRDGTHYELLERCPTYATLVHTQPAADAPVRQQAKGDETANDVVCDEARPQMSLLARDAFENART